MQGGQEEKLNQVQHLGSFGANSWRRNWLLDATLFWNAAVAVLVPFLLSIHSTLSTQVVY